MRISEEERRTLFEYVENIKRHLDPIHTNIDDGDIEGARMRTNDLQMDVASLRARLTILLGRL